MAVETPAWADQASTYNAEQTRRAVFFPFSTAGGVKASGDLALTAPVSGMSVNVAAGEVLIPGSSSTSQGLYYGRNGATVNLSIAAANPSNPRIDLVCATVDDAAYTGALNDWKLQVLTGTPTTGATLVNLNGAPTLPTSSLLLGYVLVPAATSNIVTGDISDRRPFATLGLAHLVTPHNTLDDGSGNASIAGNLAVTGSVTGAPLLGINSPQVALGADLTFADNLDQIVLSLTGLVYPATYNVQAQIMFASSTGAQVVRMGLLRHDGAVGGVGWQGTAQSLAGTATLTARGIPTSNVAGGQQIDLRVTGSAGGGTLTAFHLDTQYALPTTIITAERIA